MRAYLIKLCRKAIAGMHTRSTFEIYTQSLKELKEQARKACSLQKQLTLLIAEIKEELADDRRQTEPDEYDDFLMNMHEKQLKDSEQSLQVVNAVLFDTGDKLLSLLPAYEKIATLDNLCKITGTDKRRAMELQRKYIHHPGRSMFVDLIFSCDFEPEKSRFLQSAIKSCLG